MPKSRVAVQTAPLPAVLRSSTVPVLSDYGSYRRYLRIDFYYTCAYCTMTEAEAQGIRFEIDHYEPQSARPDLASEYSNLMYSCSECNLRKTSLNPPEAARASGFRIYRADADIFEDHFDLQERKIYQRSATGEFTIEMLDLNRQSLKRLRELRRRLWDSHKWVAEGIHTLRQTPIDQLPVRIRAQALSAVKDASRAASSAEDEIDAVLRAFAASPLLDEDPEAAERALARASTMKRMKALYPGSWKGNRKSAGKKRK